MSVKMSRMSRQLHKYRTQVKINFVVFLKELPQVLVANLPVSTFKLGYNELRETGQIWSL